MKREMRVARDKNNNAKDFFKEFTFADGEPFGIKEE